MIKALEIKTPMLFNLDFGNDTILSRFVFFCLIFYLYFLIPPAIAQIFNPISEVVIPIGMLSKEAKAKIQIHPGIVEDKIRKC